jgi:hypothetical protein
VPPVYCRACGRGRAWKLVGRQNTAHPTVSWLSCLTCGYTRVEMADVTDGFGLAYSTVDTYLRARGLQRGPARAGPAERSPDQDAAGRFDYDDAAGYLIEQLFVAYRRWDPARCRDFTPYASEILRRKLLTYVKRFLGAVGRPKLLSHALPIDPPESNDVDDEQLRGGDDRYFGEAASLWLEDERSPDLLRALR